MGFIWGFWGLAHRTCQVLLSFLSVSGSWGFEVYDAYRVDEVYDRF